MYWMLLIVQNMISKSTDTNQVDNNLHCPLNDSNLTKIDVWWAFVFASGRYSALSKMVKAILSCFHGPKIEATSMR